MSEEQLPSLQEREGLYDGEMKARSPDEIEDVASKMEDLNVS